MQVLTPGASQADVYESAVSGIVDDVLEGFNGTIMAYGQVRQGLVSVHTSCAVLQGRNQGCSMKLAAQDLATAVSAAEKAAWI